MRGFHFVLGAWVLAGTAMIECNNDSKTCVDGGSCVDSGVPTVSGGGCDSSKTAAQGGCAVDDGDGFFVAPSGNDKGAGSKVAPFASIGQGILAAAAAPLKPNVYVCTGNYPENLVIQNAPAGVALHGGFDCVSWTQVDALVTVTPAWVPNSSKPQFVLYVNGAAALVEGLTLTAPNTTDFGASSIGALVAGSPGTTFRRATVTAGSASNGGDGVQAAQLGMNANGTATSDGTAPPAKVCPCSTDSTTGGSGGGFIDGGFSPPANGAPVVGGNLDAGRAGTVTFPPGNNGADGLPGKSGSGTTMLGNLTANGGWVPSNGAIGVTGGTAQGGGGAYGDPGSNVSGGSGGCGGCGGQGGAGGGGGGGSIAIGVIGSTLRIQASTIRAGKAGNGGNGAAGQLGQPGGIGGKNQAPGGGTGGSGGGGGVGGGGAGGVSIAIATASTTPDIDQQSSIVAGTAGTGGHDGTAVQNKAIDGIAAALHDFGN